MVDVRRRVGQNVRRLRDERGWTQEHLAELSSIDQSQISQIEAGKVGWSAPSIQRLCDAFNVDPEALFVPPEKAQIVAAGDRILRNLPPDDIQTIEIIADGLRAKRSQASPPARRSA